MKKVISFFIIILVYYNLLPSNPLPVPKAIISELKIEGNNTWFLEISLLYSTQNHKDNYDSICIETSSGFSRIRLDNVAESTDLFVVTSDSLTNPLSINREGDFVKVYSYLPFDSFLQIDSLSIGNYRGSTIDSLPSGYSIAKLYNIYNGFFCKDMNPTIGLQNDSVGTCGIIKGHLYDKNNNLITDELYHSDNSFHLDNYFSLEDDDTYSTNIYSRKNTFEHISIIDQSGSGGFKYVHITPIELDIYPGCLYERDIHILDDITGVDGNNSKPDNNIIIMNYPNPFNSSTNFAVTIPSSQKYKHKQINIYNTLGQKINSIPLKNQSSVQWDGKDFGGKDAATGTYFYQLILDNKVCKSGSMILLK